MSDTRSRIPCLMCYLAFFFLFLLPLSALGTRYEFWNYKIGLLFLALALLGASLILIVSVVWFLARPNAHGINILRLNALVCLPAFAILVSTLLSVSRYPAIHNISTDTLQPPQFIAAPKQRGEESNPLTYDPEDAEAQQKAYPQLTSLHSQQSRKDAFKQALSTAQDLGWKVYALDADRGHIEAVETTFWFGFKDDVVIRIQPAPEGGSLIDLRSVSRVGMGDMGANAQRIIRFQNRFSELAAQS